MADPGSRGVSYSRNPGCNHLLLFPLSLNTTKYMCMLVFFFSFFLFVIIPFFKQEGTKNGCKLPDWMLT
jgi:hypothetical protein